MIEPPRPGTPLPSLTGMRWWAALMVFLVHSVDGYMLPIPAGTVPGPILAITDVFGYVGVSWFFVLSGFVLTWTARDSDTAGSFYRRRIARIVPNHLVTTALSALLVLSAGLPVVGLLSNVLLTTAWSPDYATIFGLNGVTWSLSNEAFFYQVFPFLLPFLLRIRGRWLWASAGALVAAVLVMPLVAGALPSGDPLPFVDVASTPFWFGYLFPPARILEFLVGVLLARIVMSGRRIPVRPCVAWVLLAAACVLATQVPTLFRISAVTVVPVALLIGSTAQADIAGRTGFLGSRVMVWLGTISFALYLVHGLAMVPVGLALSAGYPWTPLTTVLAVAMGLAASVLASWLLFVLVEKPAQRLVNRFRWRPGRTRPVPREPGRAAVAADE